MKFLLSDIKAARFIESQETIEASLLGDPPSFIEFHKPLQTSVRAQMAESDVVVSGKTQTTIRLTCGRCLDKFEQKINVDFEQVYGLEADVIDVTGEIRESVLIDLPLNAVCKESCAGICSGCGANRNIVKCKCMEASLEPRWDALKNYKFK